MELLNLQPARIWRLLIPSRLWLFADRLSEDELIFAYRRRVYFVQSDGAVLAMPKPPRLEQADLESLMERLAASDDTIDYDDQGVFDIGSILRDMGYVVPVEEGEKGDFCVEIVNTVAPREQVKRYQLRRVSFVFALYHALMRCRELNSNGGEDCEYEVKRIEPLDATLPLEKKWLH